MSELYAFLFMLALGGVARLLYLAANALARRTAFIPATVAIDFFYVLTVAAGFIAYIIISGITLAPYQFAAMIFGWAIVRGIVRKK